MDRHFLRLSDVPTGSKCIVVKVHGYGTFRHRIIEMGFVKGEKVTVIKNAPLKDPIEYKLMDSHISLRRSEAELIEVLALTDEYLAAHQDDCEYNGTFSDNSVQAVIHEKTKTINVALVGNPNSGKTSFFNRATGMRERVGNYSGVTVDAKKAIFKYKDYTINLIDLPGTYSITEYSPEELYVREYISEEHPDIVLNIVDSSNLERNLFLTTQLIDMNTRIVMALNMYDELSKEGAALDYHCLEQLLGFPIVPTTASIGKGINEVLDKVIEVFEYESEVSRHIHINYGSSIENAIHKVREKIALNKVITDKYAPRYLSIKMLESDQLVDKILSQADNYSAIKESTEKCIQDLSKEYKEDVRTIITNAKYGFIRGALKETFTEGDKDKRQLTNAIDTVLTHHWLGFPVLLFFIWVMFQATFYLGEFPMNWIESGVEYLGNWAAAVMPPGSFTDLIVDGVIAGVGGVLVFLPNILILFFFISLMEDTGYMARAAFIMDKLMHKIGLHGKSFIPLLIGFGCNVPAIMATRTLESRRDRILTILITPFMSCSARLPVYILLVSAFFEKNQGLVLLSIYAIGVILGILTAFLLKNTYFPKVSTPFVMELPPYRMPTMRNTVMHMWNKGGQYLKKMGTIILFASVFIWALGYYPSDTGYERGTPEQMENSYIGKVGKAIEPVIEPLGFDWKMGVSIVTGLAAKEIVVSSMGILYNVPDAEENTQSLAASIKQEKNSLGEPIFTPLIAYGFMLFILIYFPCMAAIAAIKKEAGWRWALFTIFYTTGLAWLVSFSVYQIGSLF
ncbi:ferrous iron transport protein B [Porphyromonadaceae bacterium OttesenSCG-928-L07]|nr:ferrous iron transport protein B [Porphyromonadaceae bacterium OttesenSCG-928-L07]MDL2251529.1 ferrous iron transport protein B [Odoribacter sp. OttesenSCG-928-J03]